jgi:hypothetical protein
VPLFAQPKPPGACVSVVSLAFEQVHAKQSICHRGHGGLVEAELICDDALRNGLVRRYDDREHCCLCRRNFGGPQDGTIGRFLNAVRG